MSPRHRPPRLSLVYYDPPLYFVTICTRLRLTFLANHEIHHAFREFAIRGFDQKQIAMGRYVIMPDHLHLFVSGPQEFRLDQWGRMLKSELGKVARRSGSYVDSVKQLRPSEIWERGLFDHVIRNEESYSEKWEYVRQNPVRAGLVGRVEDWPFQGELVDIYHH